MPTHPEVVSIAGRGGNKSALGVTAATVIKPTLGTVFRVIVQSAGSAGSLTLNDNNALTGNTAANQILSVPFGSLTGGQVFQLATPFLNGLVVSAIPTGGAVSITYS